VGQVLRVPHPAGYPAGNLCHGWTTRETYPVPATATRSEKDKHQAGYPVDKVWQLGRSPGRSTWFPQLPSWYPQLDRSLGSLPSWTSASRYMWHL